MLLLPDFRSAGQLIHLISGFECCGFARSYVPILPAEAIPALVQIAVRGWPSNGDLLASQHPYDGVVGMYHDSVCGEADGSPLMGPDPGPYWRSPRRKAIGCLAAMSWFR
jgi:hypothetical protein